MELETSALGGPGPVGVFKQGAEWWVEIVGADGELHPERCEPFLAALPEARGVKVEKWGIGDGWTEGVRALAKRLPQRGELVAAAFFRA